ncbi:hypothetical protein IWW38_005912, partial [Coemansia aciculifera]
RLHQTRQQERQQQQLVALPKPAYSSFSSIGSGSTATLQPPPTANSAQQQLLLPPLPLPSLPLPAVPGHPLLVLPSCGLSALRNKRKAHVDAEASPRVKRRKMTGDETCGGFKPANFSALLPPPLLEQEALVGDSSTVVGSVSMSSRASVANAMAQARIAGTASPTIPTV